MDVSLLSDRFLKNDDVVPLLGTEGMFDEEDSEMLGAYHLARDCLLNDQASMMIRRREDRASRAAADAAMAMGAGRAASFLSQAGAEAFSQARTSAAQPRTTAACSKLPFPSPLTTTALQQHHFRHLSNFLSPIHPAKASFNLPCTGAENSASQASVSPGTEAFIPCLQLEANAFNTGIGSSKQSDFFSRCTDHSQQLKKICPPAKYRDCEVANVTNEEAKHCLRDASCLSDSGITAAQIESVPFQVVDVPSSRKLGDDMERCANAVSGFPSGDQPRPVEESELQSQTAEVAADVKKASAGRSCPRKRARAAEIHNLSERKRRDKINLKMKALQELIPNANKTDKASVLDEAIEYMKSLQAQVQFMSLRTGVVVPQLMIPPGMQYLSVQGTSVFPCVGMGMDARVTAANDGAGDGVVSLPHLHGHSLPKRVLQTSDFQSSSSGSVIEQAREDLQNSVMNQSYRASPAHQHQQQLAIQFSMQTNADMYSSFLQPQQQTQMNGVS